MEDNYENLIKYIQGNMEEGAKKEMKEQFENDSELEKEASFLKDLAQVSEWKGMMEEAQDELDAEKNDRMVVLPSTRPKTKIKPIFFRKILAYAASVSILLAVLSTFYANNYYSNTSLASTNTERLGFDGVGLNSFRTDTQVEDVFQKGLDAIESKDFAGAVSFFEAIPTDADNYLPAKLFLAFAQFEQKEYTTAATNAEIVAINSQNAITRHRAEWLQVQALLANGQENIYSPLLDKMATDTTHTFHKAALELKDKMSSFWRSMLF